MTEILLPRTDAGVYAQAIIVLVVVGVALWLVRRNRDLLWFVAGVATATVGLIGLRTLH